MILEHILAIGVFLVILGGIVYLVKKKRGNDLKKLYDEKYSKYKDKFKK